MARTTNAATYGLLPSNTQIEQDDLTNFVTQANLLVTEALGGQGLSDDLLEWIEANVAVHLIVCAKERQAKSEGVDGVSITYTGTFGEFLKMTTYGQTALLLDSTGRLYNYGKAKARLETLKLYDWDEGTF